MNLISMININDDRKERKASKGIDKVSGKRDLGYSVYEALELSKGKQAQSSFALHMEISKTYIR